jgi:hypothetical protein
MLLVHVNAIHFEEGCEYTNCINFVRIEVFTAVTMKNEVFRDIKTQFVPHKKQVTSATVPSRLMLCKSREG